jgi:2-oxoglutarate dehydrogenase complex dehydrogenase (E1) component-like enzyme
MRRILKPSLLLKCGQTRSFSTSTASTVPEAFRRWGHLEASINPLCAPLPRPELLQYGSAHDVARAREVYCGAIGAEFEHCDAKAERDWWASRLEAAMPRSSGFQLSLAQRRNIHLLLQQAELIEAYLGKKFPSFKRYSGEGTDAMIPALDELFSESASVGVTSIVIGQAHRGRLGLLTSLLKYPARKLFHKISGNNDIPDGVQVLLLQRGASSPYSLHTCDALVPELNRALTTCHLT